MYCVKCRRQTDTNHEMEDKDSRGRDRIKGSCVVCNTMKYKYVKMEGNRGASLKKSENKGGDIVSAIGKLNPPEMHLYNTKQRRKYNFCGPFTKLDKRLARGDVGINRLDEACKRHDIAYAKNIDNKGRHEADRRMVAEIDSFPDKTTTEKIVRSIINSKQRFGLGLKKKPKSPMVRSAS